VAVINIIGTGMYLIPAALIVSIYWVYRTSAIMPGALDRSVWLDTVSE